MTDSKIVKLFDAMWQDYLELTPDAHKIYALFNTQNTVVNDHIALRTFNIPAVTIDKLAAPLLANGYVESGDHVFKEKNW